MEIIHEIKEGKVPVNILHVSGRIDASNFNKLIEKTRQLFAGDAEYLLLDLGDCDFLSSSGLFALHNMALMAHHLEPLDPEDGWQALHNMSKELDRDLKANFKIVNLQPKVARTLNISGLLPFLDIYSDSDEALKAFGG